MSRLLKVDAGDVTLNCAEDGKGPLVVCAHGFPDCARTFRAQQPALMQAGFRVARVTMRGYAPSGLASSGNYDAAALGEDLLAVADALSPDAAVHLLGHDWGAVACYAAAALKPQRVRSMTTIAVPHLRVAGPRFLRPRQARRSWYMGSFQLHDIAEQSLTRNDMALIEKLWREWSPDYHCPEEEMAHVKAAIAGRTSAVLAYYRALLSPRSMFGRARKLVMAKTTVPAMYLHGRNDGCIGVELCEDVERAYDAHFERHIIDGAGHFVHLEKPEPVNQRLLDFLAR